MITEEVEKMLAVSANTKPVRISAEMYNLARMTAEGTCRSTSGQLEYWARLGRAAEDNPDLSIEFIRDILISNPTFAVSINTVLKALKSHNLTLTCVLPNYLILYANCFKLYLSMYSLANPSMSLKEDTHRFFLPMAGKYVMTCLTNWNPSNIRSTLIL